VSKQARNKLRIAADLYKGMPSAEIKSDVKGDPLVDLEEGENFNVKIEMNDSMAKKMAGQLTSEKVSISLESLDVELQHNQSFGMVAASTGCISNPGGPSC